MSQTLVFSKDIVEKYDIPYSTVTHYTDMGLLQVVKKMGNRRMYNEDEVKVQLEKIMGLIGKGYPLRLIRDLLLSGKSI